MFHVVTQFTRRVPKVEMKAGTVADVATVDEAVAAVRTALADADVERVTVERGA
jgi:hypothetical protein